jgi:hypothetical protein
MEIGAPMVFVIRVTQDETGATGGIVERLSTGEKARFRGLDALGSLITRMIELGRESARPDAGPRAE